MLRDLNFASVIPGCWFVSPELHRPLFHQRAIPEIRAMAPHGRKRKAGAAPMETVDKREKLAEGATVVIEHCTS